MPLSPPPPPTPPQLNLRDHADEDSSKRDGAYAVLFSSV